MDGYSLGFELAKVLGFLGVLVILSILLIRFWRYRYKLDAQKLHLSIVETLGLGGNRLLCLVRAGKCLLLLGVTDHSVRLVKELTEEDFQNATGAFLLDENVSRTTRPSGLCKSGFLEALVDEIKRRTKQIHGKKFVVCIPLIIFLLLTSAATCQAAPVDNIVPNIDIRIDGQSSRGGLMTALGILAVLTVLSLAPAILILTTSFTRIVIVFSFLRSGLGTQQTPPNQILIGIALLLTFFVMAPTWSEVNQAAVVPYMAGEINAGEAFARGSEPMKEFMLKQTREKDLALFLDLSNTPKPSSPQKLSLLEVVPAFAISELKTAFEMGFILFLPFLVIDMVVASTLMSMGMLMLPPVLISLPFKILLFVLVDGWNLVAKSLVASFR